MKKELTANADSLAHIGRMPMTSAATSMSRMAIHCRPMLARVRFLAKKAKATRKSRQNRYFSTGLSIAQPKALRLEIDTEPDGE